MGVRAKGFLAILGIKKATTWGTAVACSTGDGVGFGSLDIPGNLAWTENGQINGTVQPDPDVSGNKSVPVTVKGFLRYEGWHRIMAKVMGSTTTPTTVDTSGMQHILKVANDVDGIFDTLAAELIKDTTVLEIPSVKWHQFTISGKSGQPCEFEAQGIGDDYKYGTSATNTTTSIDAVTISTNAEVAHFKHSVVYVNAQTGADFATTTDDPGLTGWSVTVSRPHEPVFSTLRAGISAEPRRTDAPFEVSGSFEFQDLESARNSPLVTAQLAGTAQKAKIVLTGATLAGSSTQKFGMILWLPYIHLADGKPGVPGMGGQTWSIAWKSKKVAAIPTGFTTGYTDSVTIDIFNKDAATSLS